LTCQKWEAVANEFQREGIRTVKFAQISFRKMMALKNQNHFKYRIGSALGSGLQFMP
jgi:NAD dependent epimerase/dehydratase family enzyme